MLALPIIVVALVANGEGIRRPKFNDDARPPTFVGKAMTMNRPVTIKRAMLRITKQIKQSRRNSKLQVKRSRYNSGTDMHGFYSGDRATEDHKRYC